MNEEIKKEWYRIFAKYCNCSAPSGTGFVCETCKKDINFGINPDEMKWNWIDQKLKEAYLKGAKDLRKAVKSSILEYCNPTLNPKGVEFDYLDAVRVGDSKAQQFIDSIEK